MGLCVTLRALVSTSRARLLDSCSPPSLCALPTAYILSHMKRDARVLYLFKDPVKGPSSDDWLVEDLIDMVELLKPRVGVFMKHGIAGKARSHLHSLANSFVDNPHRYEGFAVDTELERVCGEDDVSVRTGMSRVLIVARC